MNTQNDRPYWLQTLMNNWAYIAIFIGLVMFPHIVGWITDSSPFPTQRGSRVSMTGESGLWMSIMIELFALSLMVMSYNLMFGFTGVISFGHAFFFGAGGYILGLVWRDTTFDPNVRLLIALILTLVISGLVGLLVGLASLRLRGVYFAIFTLAVSEMAFIYVGRWAHTNGEDGFSISDLPAWIDPTQGRINLYYVTMGICVLSFLFIRRLVNSPAGSVFLAIRENEERAQAIGYNTLYYKLISIVIAGMMAGVGGNIFILLNKKAGPDLFSVGRTVEALLMTIIGGVGTFAGPILGATGLHLADSELRKVTLTIGDIVIDVGDSWTVILGFLFVLVVMVFPYGIVGTWLRLRQRVTALLNRSSSTKGTVTSRVVDAG